MIGDNSIYHGEVTLKFYNKEDQLKKEITIKNTGTPWLFYVITRMLRDGSSWEEKPGKLMLLNTSFENQLRTNIPLNSAFLSEELGDGNEDPYIMYEFHLSYYNLNAEIKNGIGNLSGYHLALLSNNNITMSSITGGSVEAIAAGITKDGVEAKEVPPICALTTIGGTNDTDYSLNPGEYISVLWKMYFTNVSINSTSTSD